MFSRVKKNGLADLAHLAVANIPRLSPLIRENTGRSIAVRTPITAKTASNSIKLNPVREPRSWQVISSGVTCNQDDP